MPAIRGSAPEPRFTQRFDPADRPQAHHCDLGLIEDDNTPLLHAKVPAHSAKNATGTDDHTPKKEQDTMKTTATNEFSALGRTEMFSENILISGPKVPVTVEVAHAPDVGYRIFVQVNGSDVLYLTADQAATLAALLHRDSLVDSESKLVKEIAAAYSSPTADLGQLEGWDVGARLTVEDDEGSPIEVVAILDREPGETTVRELWIQRTGDFLPFDARFGSPEDWREFAAAVNAVVAVLDADILAEKDA